MRKIKEIVINNIGLKLIALLIACVVWTFVTNDNDPVGSMTISNVPITIVNEDSIADIGKVVEPQGSGTVTIKVTERRSVRSRLSRNGTNFYVEADLENINQMNTVPLTVTCDNVSVTWDEISISPSSLKVTLEDKVEQTFPVNVITGGEPGEGKAVGRTEVREGKSILIAGPESLVGIIGQVNASVSTSGLREDTELSAVLRIYDKNGAEFTESQLGRLELKNMDGSLLQDRSVNVSVILWDILSEVPITVTTTGVVADGFEITQIEVLPAQLSFAGTPEAFALMGESLVAEEPVSVQGAQEDVTQEIDLTESIAAIEDLKLVGDVDPIISATVHISRINIVQVEYPLSEITMVNKPSGMKLVFTPADKVTLNIYPPENAAEEITAEDITAQMDLFSCSREGTYTIPVEVTLPEGYTLSDEISVRVSTTKETPTS